jgi:hypothetical protein
MRKQGIKMPSINEIEAAAKEMCCSEVGCLWPSDCIALGFAEEARLILRAAERVREKEKK